MVAIHMISKVARIPNHVAIFLTPQTYMDWETAAFEFLAKTIFFQLPEYARKDYLTIEAPGKILGESISSLADSECSDFFKIINFEIMSLDWLMLDKSAHKRSMAEIQCGKVMKSHWLVP